MKTTRNNSCRGNSHEATYFRVDVIARHISWPVESCLFKFGNAMAANFDFIFEEDCMGTWRSRKQEHSHTRRKRLNMQANMMKSKQRASEGKTRSPGIN